MRKKKSRTFRSRSQKKQNQRNSRPSSFSKKNSARLIGRIQKNPRGFAFVIPHDARIQDSFVPPREARLLMSGDIVEYQTLHKGRRTEAQITRVVERACKKVLGQVQVADRHKFLQTSEGDSFDLELDKKLPVGTWVIATIIEYPSERLPGLARVTEELGMKLTPHHDHLITISRFGIEERFPEKVHQEIADLRLLAEREYRSPSPQRKDLRDLPFVTIDGEDAKDFDDAICVLEPSGAASHRLLVAIADVSFFVRPGSFLDEEAKKRSTSIYFPGYCIPMLPEALSNDLCSLNPQTDKLVLVADVTFDRSGTLLSFDFYEGIIRTIARLTYTQVHEWFQGNRHALPPNCHDPLVRSQQLFELLLRNRKARGVLDFQLPECRFKLDASGKPLEAAPYPNWESHRLIEEFMITANTVVAQALNEKEAPSLYRVHEAPLIESLEELNQLMKSLGLSFMLKEVSPQAFAHILEKTSGLKGAHTLHKAILRAQKQARYEPNPKGHFGLALKDYTHFTSPIRRYPDLIVHRSVKSFILQDQKADKDNNYEALVRVGELTSERERRAMEAERFIARRKQCWFLSERIGENLKGVISGVIAKGLFVEATQYAIEGFVPIESLPGFYEFDERKACLRRRPGHSTLSVGDAFKVQVASVSVDDNEITFFPGLAAP